MECASNIWLRTGHALARAVLTRTHTHTDEKSRTCNTTDFTDRCKCTQGDARITNTEEKRREITRTDRKSNINHKCFA